MLSQRRIIHWIACGKPTLLVRGCTSSCINFDTLEIGTDDQEALDDYIDYGLFDRPVKQQVALTDAGEILAKQIIEEGSWVA